MGGHLYLGKHGKQYLQDWTSIESSAEGWKEVERMDIGRNRHFGNGFWKRVRLTLRRK